MKYTEPFYWLTKINGLQLSENMDSLQKTNLFEVVKIDDYEIRLDPTPQNVANIFFTELRNRGYTRFFGTMYAEKDVMTRQYLIAYHVMVKDLLFKQFELWGGK